ncbi:universal stress protein UspA [Halobacteriales archaeon QS_1_68_20]|nr:MAG: universal stress protein UspA [Halobacteriales archaeon QS_1_68_20]
MTPVVADTVVVPLASESDARETCAVLREELDPGTRVVVVHVIEKGGGGLDKASVAQREETAEDVFAVARGELEGFDVETRILYDTDVAETITSGADDVGADLIVFSPRQASRLSRLLSGDVALDLITGTDRPVLVLPSGEGS